MNLFVITERLAKEGKVFTYVPEIYTVKSEARNELRRKIKQIPVWYPDFTSQEKTEEDLIETYRFCHKDKPDTDNYEISLSLTTVPEVQKVKPEPGFGFLAKIDGRDQYDEGFGYFCHFGKILTYRDVDMTFSGKNIQTKLETAMIREKKIPTPEYHYAFGRIILKDGYQFLISCYFDCEYHVHPYAYDVKNDKLIDVTEICPKLKQTQHWKSTPKGYTYW